MVTTTKEQAATPSQPNQAQPIDDFRSLLAAVPPAKADSLKERIYDWLERREQDAETAVVKAQARATIVEEQNRIVRMELQDIENNRLREEEAATRKAKAGLFAEAMSALNAPDIAAPKEREETSEEENDDQGLASADEQQPTGSPTTTHPLQPLGTNIGKKVHAGDITALDIVIKELLDEVMQLREGASANVARIMMLEDQLQTATVALVAVQLDENPLATKDPFNGARGQWPVTSTSQPTFQSFRTPESPPWSWGEEKEHDPQEGPGAWMKGDVPSLCGRRSLRNPDPPPIRGYLDDELEESPDGFDACFKTYADMMLLLQLRASDEPIAHHEIPWPVLPYTPDDKYPVPRWRARYAEKEHVDQFVKGFLASKHAEVWRGSLRDDWRDLLRCKHDDSIKEIVEIMVGLLD